MRVKMNNTESGRHPDFDNGQFHCRKGHQYEVPEALAASWVRQGIATKVRSPSKPAPEKAASTNQKKGAR